MKSIKSIFLFVGILSFTFSAVKAGTDIDTVKTRILDNLLNQSVSHSEIELLITSFKDNGTWPGINYEDISREAFEHRYHLGNMVDLAQAYQTKTSEYYKNKQVKHIIEDEIKHVNWIGMEYGYGYRHILEGFSNRSLGGRVIQYDNSFHHRWDGVNNTLSCGIGYAKAFVEWAAYTGGSVTIQL